jgi:ketosteroid isomerase-like protein
VYCNVLRLEGGRLKDWSEYTDTALVNAVLGDPREALVGEHGNY